MHPLSAKEEAVVNTGIRISLVFAAVLSVISIPLVVIFVGHNQGAAWTAAGTLVAAAGALISFTVSTVTYWKSDVLVKRSARVMLEVENFRSDTVKQRVVFMEGPAEALLFNELSMIEQEAQALLGERHTTSVIRLRSRLQESGVWSESDVYDFDVALRTRNEIAHGDQKEITRASLADAVETMRRLREKVEASPLREK